jgi:hypothetical protein
MEILLGRNVKGSVDIKIDDKYDLVSNQHAKLIYNNGIVTLQDLESLNGTYVNGKSIAVKKVTKDDIVYLGSSNKQNAYILEIDKIVNEIEQIKLDNKTDFSKEFDDLKKVYNDYRAALLHINKKSQIKTVKPRVFFTLGFGLLLLIVYLNDWVPKENANLVYPIMMLITLIPTVMGAYGKKEDISEDITDLQIEYAKQYRCPKCKKELNLGVAWKIYKSKKTCQFKCGAKY